jgi:hypothetical protein
MKKYHAAETSKSCIPEYKIDFSDTFGHLTQSYLKGRFVSNPFYRREYVYS